LGLLLLAKHSATSEYHRDVGKGIPKCGLSLSVLDSGLAKQTQR
jgi:hypothetical protein